MMKPRAILCPNGIRQEEEQVWIPSRGNYWWAPKKDRYPNTALLAPGDILLFHPLNPNSFQNAIIQYQTRQGHSETHAGYTHGAIYVGYDGLLCEAVFPAGVQISSLDDKLDENCITVR